MLVMKRMEDFMTSILFLLTQEIPFYEWIANMKSDK